MTTVRVLVIRPLCAGGIAHKVGEVMPVSCIEAHELTASGRARLESFADAAAVADAVRQQTKRQIAVSRRDRGWLLQ